MSARTMGLAAALALAGCSLLQRAPTPLTTQGEWARQRDAASRRAYLYDGMVHRATVTATHLSLEVREARARRLGEWYGWTPAELDQRLAQERKEAAETEEFLVSLYTAEPRFNDLDAPRSDWRVALKVDGADLLPARVTGAPRDAATLTLYPYIGPFDVAYRVIVPMPTAGPIAARPFAFQLSSALGKLDMDFSKPGPSLTPQEPVPPP